MRILLFTLITISCACAVSAQDAVDYVKQIKPVLQARCYACHGALKQESELRLDTAGLAKKGGASGAEILSSEPDKSELLKKITSQDAGVRMPPEGEPLTPAQIELIRKWIAQGAKAPENEEPEHDPREHWAFRTPTDRQSR